MVVDLVRDGPHGLVGGTSGSGKTEFLKTLFVSLCLNNHPDDLSIVIVDFKGGVDHDAVRPIPHVVDVATNLDIEQFKRTIVMLKAESRRRQDLLASAGASNLDSYRLARRSRARPAGAAAPARRRRRVRRAAGQRGRPRAAQGAGVDHPHRPRPRPQPAPRHAELRGQPAGADRRQRRAARLPAGAEAGALQGRAQLRRRGDDPRPLRRAGLRPLPRPRPDRVPDGPRRRPAPRPRRDRRRRSTCASCRSRRCRRPPPDRRPEDVPVEETDMFALVAAMREAATAIGWSRSAVPWPAALPEQRQRARRWPRRHDGAGVPVGLVDLPDAAAPRASRRSPTATSSVAMIGGPNAPMAEVLTTYATSLALLHSRRRRPPLRHRPARAQPGAARRPAPLRRRGRAQRGAGPAHRALT